MNIRNLARKALTKSAKLLEAADKKLEPSAGNELRKLIDQPGLFTKEEKLEVIAKVQAQIEETEHA